MKDVNNRGKYVWEMGEGLAWEPSVLSAQFFYKPKTALKNKVYYLRITEETMRPIRLSNSRHTEEREFQISFPLKGRVRSELQFLMLLHCNTAQQLEQNESNSKSSA